MSAARAGYIQAVDAGALLALARESDLFVRMLLRPGRFVTPGCPLMQVSPAARLDERLAERLRRTVFIGSRRTPVQDLEFALQQLAEMAVRALSPGINDPYTAMRCIDQLCEGLCLLASRALPPPTAMTQRAACGSWRRRPPSMMRWSRASTRSALTAVAASSPPAFWTPSG